jgi:5'-methylthioinosine phosphorylase
VIGELLGIIGGSGLSAIDTLQVADRRAIATPYGRPSSHLTQGRLNGKNVVFLARHGDEHTIPPHKINYRANIWALKHTGARQIIAVAAVGGISHDMPPGRLAFPDQIIDYTWGRDQTFFEESSTRVTHIDFTHPYCLELGKKLIRAARELGLGAKEGGTYGATQGPRLETTAEIQRLERDGCHMVGMTGMPEAALARELGLGYATCAMVVNWAAGKSGAEITAEKIERQLIVSTDRVKVLLDRVMPLL